MFRLLDEAGPRRLDGVNADGAKAEAVAQRAEKIANFIVI